MDIELRVANNTTYVIGRLEKEVYQGLKRRLGYRPDNAVFMMRKVAEKNAARGWGEEWDGYVSTVCYSAGNCRCAIKKQGTHFPTGLASRAVQYLRSVGSNVKVTDCRETVEKSLELEMSEDFEPRDYQQEVIDSACSTDRGIIKLATGGGKCIDKESLCLTEDGLLTFGEMCKEDMKVGDYTPYIKKVRTPIDYDGYDESSHIYYDGERSDSIRVNTKYGYNVVGTQNHLIKVLTSEGLEWKKLKDIKIGDYAAICRGGMCFGSDKTLSELDAYWLGMLYGDGCVTSKNSVRLTTQDDHIENFARKYAKVNNLKICRYDDKRTKSTRTLNIHSVEYRSKLLNMGVGYEHSYEKTIPLIIRKSNAKVVSMFLRGMYETDGYVTNEKSKPTVNICLSSEKFIRQLHVMLLNFGIVSSFRKKRTKKRDCFILTIYRGSICAFNEHIGFDNDGYKAKQIKESIDSIKSLQQNTNTDIIPNQKNTFKEIRSLLRISKGYHNLTRTIESLGVNKRTFDSWMAHRNPSRKSVKEFATNLLKMNNEENPFTASSTHTHAKFLLDICADFFFTPIESKEICNGDNYDFVIPKTHSFVSQGFVNHNTALASAILANRGVSPMIFYVTSIDLLRQAKDELERFIKSNGSDITVGELSGLKKDIQDITVMTVQTAVRSLGGVWKKFDEEDHNKKEKEDITIIKKAVKELIHSSKLMMCDEVQHWAAETCQIISDHSQQARYRYGLSATPFRDQGDDILIDSCFGKVIADISASKLINLGYLVRPRITMIPIDNNVSGKLSYANIYKDYIVYNSVRNNIISVLAQNMANDGRSVLILCKQIAHGKLLEKLIPDSKFLHGSHSAKKRKEHLDKMRSGEANITIASTIFDEGVDCRPLDGLILAGGGKSPTRALQRVGRVLRPYTYPNGRIKEEAMVVDFMDDCKYMRDHSKKRLKIYKTEPEFIVEMM